MPTKFHQTIVLVVSCSAVSMSGCAGSQASALQFNNAIAQANKKLSAAGTAFGQSLAPTPLGQPGDLAEMQRRYDEIERVLAEVQADMKALSIPPSQVAKDLWNAHQKFLAGQERMVKQDLKQIVEIVKGVSPAASKASQIQAILQRVSVAEKADLATVQNAQRTFAQQYNIKLQ